MRTFRALLALAKRRLRLQKQRFFFSSPSKADCLLSANGSHVAQYGNDRFNPSCYGRTAGGYSAERRVVPV